MLIKIRFLKSYFQSRFPSKPLPHAVAVARPVSCWRGLRLRRECQPGPERRRSLRDADAGASPSLSRYASSLGLCRPLLVQRRSRWRSAWDGSAGQAGQRFGRISSSIAASDLYVVASAAVVLCEAVFFACCPASLLFLFFAKANLFPLPSPCSVRNASAKHYRPRVRRWLRQRDNTCTRLQRARGTH